MPIKPVQSMYIKPFEFMHIKPVTSIFFSIFFHELQHAMEQQHPHHPHFGAPKPRAALPRNSDGKDLLLKRTGRGGDRERGG